MTGPDQPRHESGLLGGIRSRLGEGVEDRKVARALRKVGLRVSSVYDLVNSDQPYPQAVDTLIEWLPKVEHDNVREGIARALAVPEARPAAAQVLIREFTRLEPADAGEQYTKSALANALAVAADESFAGELIELATDRRHGRGRTPIIEELPRVAPARAPEVLVGLLPEGDEWIVAAALNALAELHDPATRGAVEPLQAHRHAEIRKLAKKALARIPAP